MTGATPDLPGLLDSPSEGMEREVAWLIGQLAGRRWRTATEILVDAGLEATEARKRRLRLLANLSQGRVAGGQEAYCLVSELTAGEYQHFRSAMLSQVREMEARVIASDRVFYARQPVG